MYYEFLAPGFEEIEAIATLDIMRRAGIDVRTVGIGSRTVTGSHGIPVTADISEPEVDFDAAEGMILPGGMPGTLGLERSKTVGKMLSVANEKGLLIAAICAAPSILGHKGLLKGKNAVCFEGFEDQLTGANVLNKAAVCDGNIITACGAGAALEFGFMIVKYIKGGAAAEHLRASMLCGRTI